MRSFRGVLHILMSTQSSFITWIRHPGSIVLILAVVLMYVAMSEQTQQAPARASASAGNILPGGTLPAAAPIAAAADPGRSMPSMSSARMGGELPRIVRQFSAPATANTTDRPDRLQAPELGSLLGRLEDKVKAEPSNIANRLLLAQTYNELGLGNKALEEVRAARKQDSTHARAKLVLASILSTRDNPQGLDEAKQLLTALKTSSETKQYLVAMYLGDTFIRMGDHDAALSQWQTAMQTMPVTDNRRPGIKQRIAGLSSAEK